MMRKLKTLMYLSAVLFGILAIPGMILAGQFSDLDKNSMVEFKDAIKIQKKAHKIHNKILTIDTHLDTPLIMDIYPDFFGEEFDLSQRYQNADFQGFVFRQVDFPRMKEGGLDAGFFVAFVAQGNRDDEGNQAAIEEVLGLIDLIYEKVEAHPDLAAVVSEPKDAYHLQKKGKRAIYIGIENGYAIGNNLAMLESYYDLGARYMTLSHSSNNDICDSSTDPQGPEHGGLSPFGEEVVTEMNRLGMMVDVSHISDEAVWDVLAITTAPIIASHSNARALYDHPRNLSDDLLEAIAENGGVVQVNLLYVSPNDPDTGERISTVLDVVDHIDHIVAVAGIDHVGIGSDFDGGGVVDGCEDASRLPAITLELVKRGYNKNEIHKIWSGNFMRVFRKVGHVAFK
jgi:membrane dipeptidase